ncbi:hypothetical protein evm_014050 [Chilo suppressalis]|uniref:Prothoracicotropic hormone n=2 Tax=Chilo suppressalis TaxID=168631 RepID=A0A0S1U2D0_CHISP|nr:prothoracicotropic hormone precursor [Chilo suppressalis]RVE41301.1 hypothetical protein evm_014050 [Chilo suppressalis]
MVTRSILTVIMCCGYFVFLQSMIPKAMALKKTSDVKEYMVGEQRTRRRQNYVQKMALENELFDNVVDDIGQQYVIKAADVDGNKEELPALVVDYANMIRNDIILLDNSVKTRTRKRGDVKVEKHNQAIPDTPCSCEYNKEIIDLGENYYPRYLEVRNCSNQMCRLPFKCQPNTYELTILKRRTSTTEQSSVEIPNELKHRWIADKRSVTIGCMCTRDYIIDNK